MTAVQAPVSPGRGQPGTGDHPPVPEAARLAEELGCEVTPDAELEGRYEAKWAAGLARGTADDLRALFRKDSRQPGG